MPSDNFNQAAVERFNIEIAFQADGGRDVVIASARIELMDEPQTLLGEG
ncbi:MULTISPECIES: hypothetical protein [Methylosinus]|nr:MULTISPECIES: hypothetical protein [Methylosinus]